MASLKTNTEVRYSNNSGSNNYLFILSVQLKFHRSLPSFVSSKIYPNSRPKPNVAGLSCDPSYSWSTLKMDRKTIASFNGGL